MVRRIVGCVLVVAGIAMVVAAGLLHSYNQVEDQNAGLEASVALAQARAVILEAPVTPLATDTAQEPAALPSAEVYGYPCVGILEIPALGVELPILDDWDYERLTVAPCRQDGAPQTSDFVIAGHNYTSHFGGLANLQIGDEILFTALDGTVWRYQVSRVETVSAYAVDEVRNPVADITLYTCTYGGGSRVLVGADLVEDTLA